MSVQLVLFPQFNNGQFNAVSTDPNEFVVNGINFAGLGSAPSVSVGTQPIPSAVLFSQPPTIPNSWYVFRTTIGATPAYPTVSSGKVVLASVVAGAFGSLTGVYQRLSGLTVGQSYTLRVKLTTTSATGNLIIGLYNGINTVINATVAMSSQTIITYTFPSASATDNTLWVSFNDTIVNSIEIDKISLLPTGNTPTGTPWDLSDGQLICDLYENEDLPLTLSIDDFKNVAEKVQSYSKAFKLPGTKRNNKIFDNIFETTRSGDGLAFNPYLKTQCQLKQNGFILFEGYLRLIDIQDQEGEISYNVNLYSEVVALKDVLEEQRFSNLDFNELAHNYDKSNIKNSWYDSPSVGISYTNPSTSGYRNANDTLKYPFVDWNHQIIIADGFTGSGATLGRPELTELSQAFRPFIQVKYLIDRIFQASPFSYTSTFFETADFKKLYMDFNWGEERPGRKGFICGGIKGSTTTFAFLKTQECSSQIIGNDLSAVDLGWNVSNSEFTCPTSNTAYNISWELRFNTTIADTAFFRWRLNYAAGGSTNIFTTTIPTFSSTQFSWTGNFNITLQAGDVLIPQFKSTTSATVAQVAAGDVKIVENPTTITSDVMLQALRGELGQWEFLKGIFTMFNLVSLPDNEDKNNILIETYSDTFLQNPDSKEWNWTDKIDIAEINLRPLTDLNKSTIFKFKEDEDDYSFMNYKRSVFGHLYGSKIYDASGFTILEGIEEIVAEPFAATVPKPYDALFPQLITPAIYSYDSADGSTGGFDNSPRIMYNNGRVSSGTTYFIPAFNGLSSENQSHFLQFTHLSEVPTTSSTIDFHFGECQLIQPIGGTPTNNLFNTYWLPYYNELYNPNTRTMTVKVLLTPGDINNFRFYDTVFIKNRRYRVNKINYKPNDLATVEFILIP